MLRISVVSGDCPPLLSKPGCAALGLVVDTSSHTLSSSKFGVKTYGLQQSAGGHYVVPIDEVYRFQAVPSEFKLPSHWEVYPLTYSGSTVKCSPQSRPLVRTVHSTSDGRPTMGKRGHSRWTGGHILGGAGTSAASRQVSSPQGISNVVGDEEEIRQSPARDQPEHAGLAGADEPHVIDDDATSGDSSGGESQSEELARGVWTEYNPDQGEQEGRFDRQRSGFSYSVQQVQLRPHLQHSRQLDGADPDLQVEDDVAAAGQEGSRGRQDYSQEMKEEPTVGVAHARTLSGQPMGAHRERTSTMLQPQGVPSGDIWGIPKRSRRRRGKGQRDPIDGPKRPHHG